MNDRLGLRLTIIFGLALVALYANWDFFAPDFTHSPTIARLMAWQGEEAQRSLALREGLDLKGGLRVLLQARTANPTTQQMQDDVLVIQRRVDALGVTEPLVQTQGTDKIVVELPGIDDPDLAVRTIGKTALLEYVYSGATPLTEGATVHTTYDLTNESLYANLPPEKQVPHQGPRPADDLAPASGGAARATASPAAATDGSPVPPTAVSATDSITTTVGVTGTDSITTTAGTAADAVTGTVGVTTTAGVTATLVAPTATTPVTTTAATTETVTIYPTILTGKNIRNPQVSLDTLTNETVVSFEVDNEGARWLGDFTGAHLQEYMPILLDKQVVSSPVLQGRIADQGQISGNFDLASAEALVAQLRSGSLPVPLDVVGQTQVGPTLGQAAIDAAIKGGLIGLLVVMLFMLLYYRVPGLLADVALTLYALYTLTVFRAMPVTLTLAGIAGFVLSIGMAVDANILIFERMKEELRSGRRIRQAMDLGFHRAWPSIRDSNLATLITCAILFWFGNQFGASIVKGFAITLAIGVLISMFTAIFVTRTFLVMANRWVFKDTAESAIKTPRLRALFGF